LNGLPQLKKFLKAAGGTGVKRYKNVEIDWIKHHEPVMEIYDKKGGNYLKAIDLKPFSHAQLHDLMVREGFEVKPQFEKAEEKVKERRAEEENIDDKVRVNAGEDHLPQEEENEKAQLVALLQRQRESSPTPCIKCRAEETGEVDTIHQADAGTTTDAHAGLASTDVSKIVSKEKNLRGLEDVEQRSTAALPSIMPFIIFISVLFIIAALFYFLLVGSGRHAKRRSTSKQRPESHRDR